MSRTDKTDPIWVKVARRTNTMWPWRTFHGCHHWAWKPSSLPNLCDLGSRESLPRNRSNGKKGPTCSVDVISCYSTAGRKIWGQHPKRATRRALGFGGRNRMLLRKLRHDWKLEPVRDDIDSTLHAPRRKCQARDPWHWD